MENGNLLQYLKATQRVDVDHLALVCDVAAGLAYLHGEKVVHGDLKGETSSKVKVKKEGGWLSKWTSGGRNNKEINHNDGQGELTRLTGFLTATASEEWALILDAYERASTSEANAKEAILALRRQFKYGQPQAQLSAARCLWKKVKPDDKPEEGMPMDMDNAMFNPPIHKGGGQWSHAQPQLYQQPQTNLNRHHAGEQQQYDHDREPAMRADTDNEERSLSSDHGRDPSWQRMKRHHPCDQDQDKIIPPEEDIRRLFNECMMASAGSERSRKGLKAKRGEAGGNPTSGEVHEETTEERLLDDLLATNEELAALGRYKDLERAAEERKALKSVMDVGGGDNMATLYDPKMNLPPRYFTLPPYYHFMPAPESQRIHR
ncbi:hypothetical protein PQX77_009468 [Marasmius sp. AFHP31]|nr:hypothetical protein PQX77_009468 [Marasmius sp. AFHP31]